MSVVLVYDSSYQDIQKTVERLFSRLQIDLDDLRVLIKPNALTEREPEAATNTHPAVIGAVIEAAKSAGAREVVVADNPGQANYGNIRALFEQNGLGEAAGDCLRNFGTGLTPRRIPSLEEVDLYVPQLLFDVDYVINVPKLKVHPNTGLTCAIKNCYGYLPGAQKAYCHEAARDRQHFERILVDVCKLRRPDLTIVDGILATEGRPKVGSRLRYLGKILASHSAPAVDVLAASILGLDPTGLYHVVYAAEDENVALDPADLSVEGEWNIADGTLLPAGFNPGETRSGRASNPGLLESATSKRFMLDEAACTGCGDCITECPTSAVSLDGGYPSMNRDRCVACFACVEICAPGAIRLESLCPAE